MNKSTIQNLIIASFGVLLLSKSYFDGSFIASLNPEKEPLIEAARVLGGVVICLVGIIMETENRNWL